MTIEISTVQTFFQHKTVTDGVMMLRASNQVLCNKWSYRFYDMLLSTK